jgi:signal transduction histidine kinase
MARAPRRRAPEARPCAWYNWDVKLKPALILMLLVVVPLALLAWVGVRLARQEREMALQQVRDLLTDRLRDIDRRIGDHCDELERQMRRLTAIETYEADALREIGREDARVLQLFVIGPDGRLLYPDPLGPLNRNEEEFLTRASQIITDRELQRAAAAQMEGWRAPTPSPAKSPGPLPGTSPAESTPESGWFVWYWGRGLNLVYWHRRESGHIVGAALDRSRWIADLIAILPDTPQRTDGEREEDGIASQIRLVDSASQPVYQWGAYSPPEDAAAICEIPLSSPLSAWRLQQFVPAERLAGGATSSIYFNLGTGLAVAALALVAMAVYFYREYARDIREAARRVSFVNQVSHELRTPLTNIRMYADLLESDLDGVEGESAERSRGRLNVIQLESQRLSRLIGNVLTFARQQRKALRLNPAACRIDEVVGRVVERFRPSLAQLGIECDFKAQAGRVVEADADAVEQIVGNLINNVEKYAADGKWMEITTRFQNGRTLIGVSDRGPGVDRSAREAIFQPFWRGSHSVSGAAGTGIGLSIARELARLHGGDVTLLNADRGAVFLVELSTPEVVRRGSL